MFDVGYHDQPLARSAEFIWYLQAEDWTAQIGTCSVSRACLVPIELFKNILTFFLLVSRTTQMTVLTVPSAFVLLLLCAVVYIGGPSNMIKRFSSTFKKGRPKEDEAVNGRPSPQNQGLSRTATSSTLEKRKAEDTHHSVKREEVQSSLQQFAQLIHTAKRPLPTQSGDGTYLEHEVPSSMMEDLKSLGFKDVKTLMAVMKTKASGELADDKTYLMERVIQASSVLWQGGRPPIRYHTYRTQIAARQRITCALQESN